MAQRNEDAFCGNCIYFFWNSDEQKERCLSPGGHLDESLFKCYGTCRRHAPSPGDIIYQTEKDGKKEINYWQAFHEDDFNDGPGYWPTTNWISVCGEHPDYLIP